jgi:transcriptional regulator with XRE-family HTH domain
MRERRAERQELADFLASRRRQADPRDSGIAVTGARRVAGLRREEVSVLSGVSVTWYTWLEQGRDVNPSRQVLEALAAALRLSAAESRYLLELGGYPGDTGDGRAALSEHAQTLLDALGTSPAYAITDRWDIVGWNRAYELLYPAVAAVDESDRNLLWLVFTDPSVRELLTDWAIASQRFLTHFRADAGPRISDPYYARLIDRLKAVSDPFRTGWDTHDVEGFVSRERHFQHPVLGALTFEHHQLTFADAPQINLVAYTATQHNEAPHPFATYVQGAAS